MLLAFVEHEDGVLAPASAGVLALAGKLAAAHGVPVAAVAFGACAELAAELTAELAAARLIQVRHELLTDYSPELWGESLAQLTAAVRPVGVVGPGTERGNEVMAQVAARISQPLAANCTEVAGGALWTLTRVRGGGMLLEDAELAAEVKLVTVAQGAGTDDAGTDDPGADDAGVADVGAAGADDAGPAAVEEFRADLPAELVRSRVVRRTTRTAGVTLASAPVVVSGGRGVGSADGYATLEELAGLLGGVVGCSRVATNNGWRPHSDQVGLTGTQIAPDLYVACGISGATQHWVGCMNSRTILAINTDPQAPMVTRARYAVIGDVHAVLPAVIEEIRRRAAAHPR